MWNLAGNFLKLLIGRGGTSTATTALALRAPQANLFLSALKAGGETLWGGTKDLASGILTVGTATGVAQLAEAGWNYAAPGEAYDTTIMTTVTGFIGDLAHGALDFMGTTQSKPLTTQEAMAAGFTSLEEAEEAVQQLMPVITYLNTVLGGKATPNVPKRIEPQGGGEPMEQYPRRPEVPQLDAQVMMAAGMQSIAARAFIKKLRAEGALQSVYYALQLMGGNVRFPTRAPDGRSYDVPVTVDAFMLEATNMIGGR